MSKQHTSKPQAFTLIELLVVMTVIGVLIAMLLPSLGKAKKAASVIVCGSNQRQVGVGFASYATDWRQYPTPDGQPGFDSNIVNIKYIPAVWLGWTGYGTVSWNYTFGLYTWWVGAVTQDMTWYKRKEFMCTANMPGLQPTTVWHERIVGWDSVNFGSMIRGQLAMNTTDYAQNVASPWYLYFHPYTTAVNMYDWWDCGLAGTDVADQVFGRNVGYFNEYKYSPTDGLGASIIGGPRVSDAGRRRAQLCCPNVSNLPPGGGLWLQYEPHGDQVYTGTQNGRAPNDPEDRNYLYTDGSVIHIVH